MKNEFQPRNATELWQIVLEKLQNEMVKASFDTWLSDTEVKSLENNVLRMQRPISSRAHGSKNT